MGIKEQMESTQKFADLKIEEKKIDDDILSLEKDIANYINTCKVNICNEIKQKIFNQGRAYNFQLSDDGNIWSMKNQNLEYRGDFSVDEKHIDRISGSSPFRVEFILEIIKESPINNFSLMVQGKNELEMKEKLILKKKAMLDELKEYKSSLHISDVVIKYRSGDRNKFLDELTKSLHPQRDSNYLLIGVNELVKLIIG